MIKKIRFKNFYGFADAEINLDNRASVLVGINGSGKSNLLKAIRLLKEGVAGMGLRKYLIDDLGGLDNILSKSTSVLIDTVELEFCFDSKYLNYKVSNLRSEFPYKSSKVSHFASDITYKIQLNRISGQTNYLVREVAVDNFGKKFLDVENGAGFIEMPGDLDSLETFTSSFRHTDHSDSIFLTLSRFFDAERDPWLSILRNAISEIVVYDYFDTTPRSQIRKPMLPTSEKRLLPNGSNLPQILNTIKINSKSSYNVIVSKLAEVNPNFKGIDFNFLGGNIELMLEEENFNSAIHVSSISDGTLRYLCLLSILYNPNRGSFICIDEPEVGLHPDMITTLGNCIVEASDNASFLISTHSENLLNCFELEQIRVVEKDATNSSIVSEYTKEDFKGWYKHFSAGTMWRSGDLGGNRW
ncbi:MAG: hypothetical protein RLZZ519_616 [Bacteroidota bacterium]|jgi:predicted ATPase